MYAFLFIVFLSCLLFLFVSLTYYATDDKFGAYFFVLVTLLSALADSIYYNHFWIDTADRFTAVFGFVYIVYSTFITWLYKLYLSDFMINEVVIKFVCLLVLGVPPLWYLHAARCLPVRSEEWRYLHKRWHLYGTMNGCMAILLTGGWLDFLLHASYIYFKDDL